MNVQRAVSSKSSIPAIEGILLRAENNVLTLTGYDLEVGIITTMEARVEEAGSVILNAKILCDILRNLPFETVRIEVDARLVCHIKSGDAEFSLIGISADEYPELPTVESGYPIVIDSELLKDMIRKTIFATAENDVKVVHTGVRFEIREKKIRLVAVDGFRLAIRNEEIDYEGEEKVFVAPKKTAISGNVTGEITVNTRMLINSIERTSLIITDRAKSPIRCIFDEDLIKISSTTALGTANDKLPCKGTGHKMEIGFNNRYLLDALRVCDADEVVVRLSSPILPILITPTEGENFLFLVLPVRLKTE